MVQGLLVRGLLSLNASHYLQEDYDHGFGEMKSGATGNIKTTKQQRHSIDMVERELINLDIDLIQMGLGGEDILCQQTIKKNKIKPKNYDYSYKLMHKKSDENTV